MSRTQPTSFFDHIVAPLFGRPFSPFTKYLTAAVIVTVMGFGCLPFIPDTLPWLLCIPVTLVVALIIGKGPGLLAAVGATGFGIASLGNASNPAWLNLPQWVAAFLFLLVVAGLVMLAAELRASMQRTRELNLDLVEREARSVEREAFLASVLSSSTDCIKVLDLEGRLTFMTEGGQRIMEVSDFNAISGCPWPDFWQGAGNTEAKAAIEAARQGEARSFVGMADTFLGKPKWWHVAVSPILGADGRPERILSVSRDISEARAREDERDRFVRLAENSPDFIGMAHADGRVFYMNDAARQLVGLDGADIPGLVINDFFPPEHAETVARHALPAVKLDGHWAGELNFRHFRTGALIPVFYTLFPITDAAGTLIGYGTVTRDYRELKRAEEDMRFLNGELAHRLKNTLAIVQSIAQQTLRKATDTETAAKSIGARLVALSTATDVLTSASWRSANLHELATRTLSPHGTISDRILLRGPPVTLKPEVSVAFALALHELATNATKYGSLSNDNGTVTLSWTVDGTGEEAGLSVKWQEQGGPLVSPPLQKGFGSTLIERSLRSYFSGSAATDYRPDGLVFMLQARLSDAVVVAGT